MKNENNSFTIPRAGLLRKLMFWLVVVPPLTIFIPIFGLFTSILWFLIPATLFRSLFRFYDFGNFAPWGWLGWAVTVLINSTLAILLWLPFALMKNSKR